MSSKYRHLYQFYYVKVFSTNQNVNLVLSDDPGRVRSQITSVVGKIQQFDFDCNLVVARKVIIRTFTNKTSIPSVNRPLAHFGLDSNFKTLITFNFTYKGGIMIFRY